MASFSSAMATLFTFSSLLLTTHAPPTYANPAVPLLQSPWRVFLLLWPHCSPFQAFY